MRKIKSRVFAVFAVAAVASLFTVCKVTGSGGDVSGKTITWTMDASPRTVEGTAELSLGFTPVVQALAFGDFTFEGAAITADTLGGSGAARTISVSNVPEAGIVKVSVKKTGFVFNPASYEWNIADGSTEELLYSTITFMDAEGEVLAPSPFDIEQGTVIPAAKIPASGAVVFEDENSFSGPWDGRWASGGVVSDLSLPVDVPALILVPYRTGGQSYTITLDAATNGGSSGVPALTGTYPNTVGELPAASKSGSAFVHWTAKADGTGDILKTTDRFTANKTYYAVFETVPRSVTLTFETVGIGTPSFGTRNVMSNQILTAEDIPPVSGASYELDQWNSAADGGGNKLEAGDRVTQDTTYYAIWKFPADGINWGVDNPNAPWEGGSAMLVIPKTGYYKVQLWGGQGGVAGTGSAGNYNATTYIMSNLNGSYAATGDSLTVQNQGDSLNGIMPGGKGAYTSGHVFLHRGDVIALKIGGSRVDNHDPGGGYNGGGSGVNNSQKDGAGGGATDIRIARSFDGTVTELVPLSGSAIDTDVGLINRIMVAAGGGGSADARTSGAGGSDALILHKGGAGGGVLGNYGSGQDPGKPASQTAGGGIPGHGGEVGSFGKGGSAGSAAANESYGAGGGGWFGGASGGYTNNNGSGAGGSSYVSGFAGDALNHGLPCIGTQKTANGAFSANTGGTVAQNATSWTGYFFTRIQILDGYQQVPNTSGSGTEQGHSGAGSAEITWIGTTDASVDGD
jgi:hypothetical protein